MFNRSYIYRHQGHPHYLTDSKISSLQKYVVPLAKEEGAEITRHLSDPTKLKIYIVLTRTQEVPVSDLVNILGISQSAVSHALSDLKQLGIIQSHRCGQLICYSLKSSQKLFKLRTFLRKFLYD